MTEQVGTFPFGQPIHPVVQGDTSLKKVFVLGVYASAVHARWVGPDGKTLVRALGVASEPYIFWRGEGVEGILSEIEVPKGAGSLEPASGNLNGPSGNSLDGDFLEPLGLSRDEAWLCDLVPHSCMNEGQSRAIKDHYKPLALRHCLPEVVWPTVPKTLANDARCREIAAELRDSQAEVLVTLGDLPLKWFCAGFGSRKSLRTYGTTRELYGSLHDVEIEKRRIKLLPLVHPRQAARLGAHALNWAELHDAWKKHPAPELLG